MLVEFRWSFGLLPLALAAAGCHAKTETSTGNAATATVTVSASASAAKPAPKRHNWALPSGPALAVIPGQGVGSIFLGATIATIERQMSLPCDVKTEDFCRYIGRGVDFHLENGVTTRIHVQRAGRPAGKDKNGEEVEFGFFNGAILPDLRLGMIPAAIEEHLGPPSRKESGGPGVVNNAEVHEYDGMRLEYDRIENGNLVLGGIWIFKSPTAGPKASASASAAVNAAARPAASARPGK